MFNASSHHVVEILDDEPAKRFVIRHHYSGSYPAARRRFGLYRGTDLVGIAVFSEPTSGASKRRWFPGVEPMAVADLGRLVLLDEVAFNGESWFVARCLDRLRRDGIEGVISYSDPMPRERADGAVVTPGHVGIVYQALSAEYAGRTSPEQMHLLPDGTALSRRVVSKIRHGERGRAYGVRMLVRHGATALETADAPAAVDDPTGWLEYWLPRIARSTRHPGNHRYLWGLTKAARRLASRTARDGSSEPRPYPRRAIDRGRNAL